MSNGAAFAALDRWIAGFNAIPEVVDAAAHDLAESLKVELARSVAAQESPNGDTWPKGKDGHAVLRGAAGKVDITVSEKTVIATLGAPEAYHHFGTGHVPRRPILPSNGSLPPTLADAFAAGLVKKVRNRLEKGGK